jgi:translation initiation factor IF-3
MLQNYSKKVRANEQIRVPQIRLIGAKGEQIGIVPTKEGLRRAQEEGLDLVEVASTAKPPVCRILDLGKYLYSLSKKEKEARKKQKVILVKEVKMTPKIEEHDYQTKLRNARKFVERGDKVKLTLFFRGREITHADLGQKIVQRFIEDISDTAEVERNDGLEGNAIHLYFTPKGALAKKALEGANSNEKEVSHAENKDEQSGQETL